MFCDTLCVICTHVSVVDYLQKSCDEKKHFHLQMYLVVSVSSA